MAETFTNKTIPFELVSPERVLASEEVLMVVIPGEAGDFGVLADHAPLLSSIRPGVVFLHLPSGEIKKIFVAGGFADVNGTLCTVLAEEAVNVAELDRAQIEESLKGFQESLDLSKEDAVKSAYILQQIGVAQAKLAAAAI
ncbi:MAG: ATP synthase F1 subunit epsilon [Proteobacteria bacterium]|nr:ATP synthase F1 subunit epsilon [Pseudomonadota bacterium]